ncbi:MAG: D-alanine--D-alanine ligase family protein [Gammaproteobacteria bacterium]|nr:D-alanine--D-alanine ligase family protein [Gammaproteobacteria bacterium]
MVDNLIRVAVLYGGQSGEHEISLLSAASIIRHLDRSRFTVIPIGIDRAGNWLTGKESLQLLGSETLQLPEQKNLPLFHAAAVAGEKALAHHEKSGALFDVIFPAVHGALCEDGTLQGLLEQASIPYVGCGVLASALGMEKDISKRLARDAGIPIAPYCTISFKQWETNPTKALERITSTLQFPVFVKPVNTGSSVGVEKIRQPSELSAAIQRAFRYDTKVIVEQGIKDIAELEIAVLESLNDADDPLVSVVGEIRPHHEFYSYDSKYLDKNGAESFIPAPFDQAILLEAQQMAKDIFILLECEGMARVDLFLEKSTGKILFNEVNTLPGFTAISMYPKLMAASGMEYSALLTHLIMLALKRQTRKNALCRAYNTETKTPA